MPKLKVLIKPYPNNYTIHNNIIYINGHSFSFDTILQTQNLESMYEKIKESTLNFLEGKNSTIFAYGQTGSGKSYTMGLSGKTGVIQFALKDLFEKIRLEKEKICLGMEEFDMVFKISMLEIYNEELFDLLNNKQHLSLKFNNNLVISGLKEVEVKSYEESVELINLGLKIRATKKTAMNNTSSRSHGIIFVSLYKVNELISKFSFVDLAGSERIKKSKVSGLERKEAISINSSLLSLCNCINLLSQKAQHIPYRQSKLTRILQDALEGECFTAMIVCINGNNFESYDALNYATRAMNIQSSSVKKQNVKIDFTHLIKENGDLKCLVDQLRKENEQLKKENENLKIKIKLSNENKPMKIENNFTKEKENIPIKKCKIKINKIENNKLHKLKENEKEILFQKLTNITVNDLLNTPIKRVKENKKVTFSDQNEYKYFKPIKEKINFLEKINNKIKNEEEENYKS